MDFRCLAFIALWTLVSGPIFGGGGVSVMTNGSARAQLAKQAPVKTPPARPAPQPVRLAPP